jgi:DNA polymerase III delta prime subunit
MTSRLQAAIDGGRLPHANLLVGGAADEARLFAAAINCLSRERKKPCGECVSCVKLKADNHPDTLIFDCAQAKVEQIRALTTNAQTLPNESFRRVFILLEADELSPICQNALLKTLEEPPGSAAFILTAKSPSPLLPTVRSRLTVWNLRQAAGASDSGIHSEKILSAYDAGSELEILLSVLACDKLTRDEAGAVIDSLRKGLLKRGNLSAVEKLGALRLTLERNAGIGHVCGAVAVILSEIFEKQEAPH